MPVADRKGNDRYEAEIHGKFNEKDDSWSTTWIKHYLLLFCATFDTYFATFYLINALTHIVSSLGDTNSH